MEQHLQRHVHSFKYAWNGLLFTIKSEPNFTIHLVISFGVVLLGLFLNISRQDMTFILILIIVGLATELANTAIENVTDLVTKEHRYEAKIAKDVAAGMMLLVAIGSIIIAIITFYPYILATFS